MINFIIVVGFLLAYTTYSVYIYVYITHLIIFLKLVYKESLSVYLQWSMTDTLSYFVIFNFYFHNYLKALL